MMRKREWPRPQYSLSYLVVLVAATVYPSASVSQEWDLSDPTTLIEQMIGSWRFELRSSSGDRSITRGTRTFEPLVPGQSSLLWTEHFDDRTVIVRGLFSYDAILDRFIEVGVSNLGDLDRLVGAVSADGYSVHWFGAADPQRATVVSLDFSIPGQFTYTSERFRAVFRKTDKPRL